MWRGVLLEFAMLDFLDHVDQPLFSPRLNANLFMQEGVQAGSWARRFWIDPAADDTAARAGCRSLCRDEGDLPLAEPQILRRSLTALHQSVTAA